MDQRNCIKFCVKNEIKCADAFRMLTVAYGEATLDRSNVYRWYKMFSEGREDVNDEARAGRPSTSTTDEKINEVEKMILANRRITVREVAEDLNISIGSCHSIFINDLGMRRVAAKFVPKLLNCDKKQHRMNIANEMLDSVRDDPNLLQRVITGDEAWVYGYDVETKAQSSQWKKLPHEPRPKKARQVRSNVKVLLTVFFDCRGVVHHEFLPQGRTVHKEYYLQVMRNLREAIRQKRPDLWKNKNWLLHHDNAPAHTSLLVRDLLAKNNTLMMPQPPYSPDLAPCDFLLFPKLKRPMKGRRYATLDEIKTASKEELKNILKNAFLKCFEDWKNRWHNCIYGDFVKLYLHLGEETAVDEQTPWNGVLCGKVADIEQTHYSSGSALVFHFHTDWQRANNTGFRGTFRFLRKRLFRTDGTKVSEAGCDYWFSSENSTQRRGSFYSPNYPSTYPHDVRCAYTFEGRPSERVKVVFEHVLLQRGDLR
ncbi:hypothetical protein LAZ67_19001522 [Cordylochernes scorpioides]|uniref:CUB domain-containing protein n=1 Tax=Cordylochernes scorpioides TaxID=51811 RepID=A0ABY6LMH5_9ARAC|nr:hypothetical protein LAZ67_19001522 [Cordylochernes scorpioides]